MANNGDETSGQTADSKNPQGAKPGGEEPATTLNGRELPTEDQVRPVNEGATKSGEYVDITVDTEVNPKGKDMPRPTAARGA